MADRYGKCKACDAPIRWARNVDTDRGVPLDPNPVADGNVLVVLPEDVPAHVVLRSGEWPVTVVGKGKPVPLWAVDAPRYQTHFATCSHPEEFRKDRPRARAR